MSLIWYLNIYEAFVRNKIVHSFSLYISIFIEKQLCYFNWYNCDHKALYSMLKMSCHC